MRYRDINFGADDAKADPHLAEYFLRIPEYEKVRRGEANFVIGRKGTGKTAICQMIYEESQHNPTLFAQLLSFKNAPSTDLFASSDKTYRAPNEYISTWKFLIALECAKLLLKDESVDSDERQALEKFLHANFGNTEVASMDALSTLRTSGWKVGIDIADFPFLKLPSGGIEHHERQNSYQKIHYGRAGSALLDRILRINSQNEYFLLFDELDEDYRIDDRYNHLIISLLKAAYQIKNEVIGHLKLRPIIVLREDIFSKLDDHDLNKLDDTTVRLLWTHLPSEYTEFSLKELINERVRVNFGIPTHADLWPTIVDEENWGGPGDSAWSFLVNRTMDRPRDIIKSMKCCQPCEPGEKLTAVAIKGSMIDYSRWLFDEIGNEIHKVLPEYREAIGLLTKIGSGIFDIHQWRSEFGKESILYKKYASDTVLEMLFSFSVVGMVKGDRWFFKYKTPQVTFDYGVNKLVVHYGLEKFLVIPQKYPYSRRG